MGSTGAASETPVAPAKTLALKQDASHCHSTQQLRNEFVNQSGRFEYNITFSNALAKTPLQTYSDSSSNPHSSKFTPHKNNNKKNSLLQTYIPTYMPYFKVPLKGSRAGSGRVQRVHQHLEKKQPGEISGFTPHQSESRRTDQQLHLIYLHYLRRTPRAAGSFTDRFRMV